METLVTSFLALPNIAIYAIFGAVGGAVGALLGSLFSKIFKKEKLSGIVTIVCVVMAIQLPSYFIPQMKKAAPQSGTAKLFFDALVRPLSPAALHVRVFYHLIHKHKCIREKSLSFWQQLVSF